MKNEIRNLDKFLDEIFEEKCYDIDHYYDITNDVHFDALYIKKFKCFVKRVYDVKNDYSKYHYEMWN